MRAKRFSHCALLLQKITFASDFHFHAHFSFSVMTITWEDFSRGFHGGRFESDEIKTFDFTDEIQKVQFTVQEYTSDETDFFGVACPKWEIIVTLKDIRIIVTLKDIRSAEYEIDTRWRIGEDYARAEYAQEFCEYALQSIKKHGNISRLPFSELAEED